jgi:hypothetical protein
MIAGPDRVTAPFDLPQLPTCAVEHQHVIDQLVRKGLRSAIECEQLALGDEVARIGAVLH